MSVLDKILAAKREEVAARRRETPWESLAEAARRLPAPPGFVEALCAVPVGVIAEVKRRSPSAGPIRVPMDVAVVARAYEAAGARAVSVLVDGPFFGGGEDDVRAVRAATGLPLLYKEFVLHPWQVWHAASLGASAVLLIVAALPPVRLAELMATCREAGLAALVEVHDAAELGAAAAAGARLIGVNNRDLHTFRTDLSTSEALAASAPREAVLVSESGIRSAEDVRRLRGAGYRAVLVGEHLLRRPDPGEAVRDLLSGDA